MNPILISIIAVVLCAISITYSLMTGSTIWQLTPVFLVLWCSYVMTKNRKVKGNKRS
ncbi:hypothetical protein GMA19_00860 [Paenibacillus polymyxa E681]|nr:hypothetical protein GE561_00861 [Paenibacillus polymyxa E681]QNV60544.1 hypothetical protein GMA19_00860 [Paenibacillus polymyxa E681]